MKLDVNLTKLSARLAVAFALFVVCGFLLVVIVSRFVVGTLSDDRLLVTRDMLRVPVEYFPGSARLNARLAAAEIEESDRDLESAEFHARRAVTLSPGDYRFKLTLASVQEANGDRAAAEQSLWQRVRWRHATGMFIIGLETSLSGRASSTTHSTSFEWRLPPTASFCRARWI